MPTHPLPSSSNPARKAAAVHEHQAAEATRTADRCFNAMVRHNERQKLEAADRRLLVKLKVGAGEQDALETQDSELPDPRLIWGAPACAVEMFGRNNATTRKAVYNWRADVKAGLEDNRNYPNPGFVFFERKNAVVLSLRAFRVYVARMMKGDRS